MDTEKPHPPYRLETPRLVVRCYEPADAPLLTAALDANREHLASWMPWAREEGDLDKRIDYVRRVRSEFDKGGDFSYGIFDRETGAFVGGTGMHTRRGSGAFEIGYWIDHKRVGAGIATESTAVLVRAAFELCHVHRVEIHCDPDNVISARIPARLGFRHDGTLRHQVCDPERGWRDSMVWTMLEDEFAGSPCADAEFRAFDLLGRPQPG